MRPTENAHSCFSPWPRPRAPALLWWPDESRDFGELVFQCSSIKPPWIKNDYKKESCFFFEVPCLHFEVSCQQFHRRLFANGGQWGKCFQGCRGTFSCSIKSGHRAKLHQVHIMYWHPLLQSNMLHLHVSTKAQSEQTRRWLSRGPFTFVTFSAAAKGFSVGCNLHTHR